MKTSRYDIEDMEIESFQHQALEVRWPDENFDPSVEPEDGESFLTKVIYERMNCPSIVVKPIKESEKISCNIPNINAIEELMDTSPIDFRPSKEWKETQLIDFSEIREKIILYRREMNKFDIKTKVTESSTTDATAATAAVAVESTASATLSNINNCNNNINNSFDNDNEKEEKLEQLPPIADEQDEWESFCRHNPPLLSTILPIRQRSLERLLEFEVDWLHESLLNEPFIMEHWLGSWIYATLATLRMPLEPFTHSALREIAKICIRVKNNLTLDDNDNVMPFNLLIVLISSYFRQLDLCKYV